MNKMKEEWIGFELLYISLVYIIYYILNKKKKKEFHLCRQDNKLIIYRTKCFVFIPELHVEPTG